MYLLEGVLEVLELLIVQARVHHQQEHGRTG
jgi:hypothetical protein